MGCRHVLLHPHSGYLNPMRKILLILLCLLLVGCGTAEVENVREMPTPSPQPTIVPTPTHTPEPTPIPTVEPTEQPVYSYSEPTYSSWTPTYDSIANDPLYSRAGRLSIPSVGIDVGLATGCETQAVTDMNDTAWYQEVNNNDGTSHIIADHNNQGFASLSSVSVGDEAVITNADGSTTFLRCKEVTDGYNNGAIMSNDGRDLEMESGNYILYTCHGDGVRAVIFEEVEP